MSSAASAANLKMPKSTAFRNEHLNITYHIIFYMLYVYVCMLYVYIYIYTRLWKVQSSFSEGASQQNQHKLAKVTTTSKRGLEMEEIEGLSWFFESSPLSSKKAAATIVVILDVPSVASGVLKVVCTSWKPPQKQARKAIAIAVQEFHAHLSGGILRAVDDLPNELHRLRLHQPAA